METARFNGLFYRSYGALPPGSAAFFKVVY